MSKMFPTYSNSVIAVCGVSYRRKCGYLRCHVVFRSTESFTSSATVRLPGQSEVYQFNVTIDSKNYVLWFQITIDDILALEELEGADQLGSVESAGNSLWWI